MGDFEKYKSLDPFPHIQPALLNSSDIIDYVDATGMIDPFNLKKIKSASYEVEFSGKVFSWDEKGNKQEKDLSKNEEYILRKNSISFLFTRVNFRLPDYIALRFNLKITHVHRGILLGTGPLIDPGYEGSLLIPLHNLTTNDYVIREGEGIIWVEFTKLGDNKRWKNEKFSLIPHGEYQPFREDKKNLDAHHFFMKAAGGREIRSSIPHAMQKSADDAKKAKDVAEKLENRASTQLLVGVVGITVTIVAIIIGFCYTYYPILQLTQDTVTYIKDETRRLEENNKELEARINNLTRKINDLIDHKGNNNSVPEEQVEKKTTTFNVEKNE